MLPPSVSAPMSSAPASTKLHQPETMLHRKRRHLTVRSRPVCYMPVRGKLLSPHNVLMSARTANQDLGQEAAKTMKEAAQCILNSTSFDPTVTAQLPIAKNLTSGLLELAWESLQSVLPDAEQPTGLVQKQMLARLVAAAWRGAAAPARLDQSTAEKVGKRLQKQVETKLRGLLSAASSKAARARTELARSSIEEGLESLSEKRAAIDAQEQQEFAAARRAPYTSFAELDVTEPEPAPSQAAAEEPASIAGLAEPAEPLSPCTALCRAIDEEQAAADQAHADELAETAEFQLVQGGGIPRTLARELGPDGCAYLLKYLKSHGGVGLVPHPREIGAYSMMRQGRHVSVSWEEALRHELPFILQNLVEHSREVREAAEAQIDVQKEAINELKQLFEQSQERNLSLLAGMEALSRANKRLTDAIDAAEAEHREQQHVSAGAAGV
jgi:hypothetical protein